MGIQVPRVGGTSRTQCPLKQAQDEKIYNKIFRPIFQHENGTYHCWIFGAMAELLDNVIDEIPNGATKVLIDVVPHPRDRSPSLLIQDDGGGMDPSLLWNCMNATCPHRKKPDSIGQNGEGFKAGVSCLGANVIVFTRSMNTRMPTQSIGLLTHVGKDKICREHIIVPMVHYKYDPVTGGIMRYEHHPGQFSINMSTLLRLSPYNSEEELLQNFNDVGPHGTKIIVFNLLRNNQGHLNLDFDTDKKDIRNNDATVLTEHGRLEDKNNLVHQYMRSFKAYVSILYLGLPKYFKIILRGEEVTLHNIAAELKHSQRIAPSRHNPTGRKDEVVMGLLDGAGDDGMDRFCFYYKHRLILPFVPLCASSHKNWSIVGVLQANSLKPAKNKQDFMWSDEIRMLQNILKEMTTTFWKNFIGMQSGSIEPSCQLTLAPPVSHYVIVQTTSGATGFHSQVNSFAPIHHVAPSFEPSYIGMPSYSIPGTPRPSLPALHMAAGRKRQLLRRAMVNARYHGRSAKRSVVHSATLTSRSNYDGHSLLHGIQGTHAHHPLSFSMASMAANRHRPTMPAIASNNDMNFNASPICTPAYRVTPFSQPSCSGMPPNSVMRAPAPHLGASSRLQPTRAASPCHVTANTICVLAPSKALSPADMVALGDLPIKMEPDSVATYADGAYPVPSSLVSSTANTIAGTSRVAEASDAICVPFSSTLDVYLPVAATHLAGPSAIDGDRPSHEEHESQSHGGNNQREQGDNQLPNQGRPVFSVKMERNRFHF